MAFTDTKLSYFHSFSKMPVENNITLGNAINKSGHTVTASEVWASDIPYYGKMAKLSDVVEKVQPYARKNDMCYITTGDDAGKTFQYDGAGNWVDITSKLVNGYVIKNAKGDDVLLYHKGVNLTYLTDKNNANTDSKDTSSKYNASRLWATIAKDGTALAEGETRLVEQFASPTDKALNGLASVTYAPSVYISNNLKTAGTDYYDYCFSGTILWASGQSSTTVTKIDCFEYIGDKLSNSVDKIGELEDIISKISVTAKGGLQGVSDDAETVGISSKWVKLVDGKEVDALPTEEGAYPVLTVSTGSVDGNDNAKLVTGATVQTYIDEAIATDGVIGDAISSAIEDATLTDADDAIANSSSTGEDPTEDKLVTAAQVKDYVVNHAQVTVKSGDDSVTSTGFEFVGSTGDDVTIDAELTEETGTDGTKTGKVTYSASLTKATVGDDGKIQTGDEGKAVSAGDAETIVTKAIEALSEDGGAIAALATRVGEAEASASASAQSASASEAAAKSAQSAAESAQSEAAASKTAAEAAEAAAVAAQGEAATSASAASQSASAAQGSASSASQSASAASASAQSAAESEAAAIQAAADAKAAKDFVEATAQWQEGTKDAEGKLTALGNFTDATKGGVVTGTTVKTVADEVLTLAKSYSDSLHTTSLDYVVLGDSESLPRASAETLGKIYLVKEGNNGASEPTVDAISGSYVEYMTRKVSETEYTWEKIGTTAADLSAYAKTADLNATDVGSGAVKVSQTNGIVTSVTVDTEALVENDAIKDSTTSDTALITAADALEAIKLAKPENYVASVSGYTTEGAEVTTTQGAAVKVLDGRGTSVTANDIWGTTATMDASGNITITDNYIANWFEKGGSSNFGWYIDKSITKVENNKVYAGDSFIANVQTDKIKAGYNMFASSSLTSFNGDLSNLVEGHAMFYNSGLTSFNGDLSSLSDGVGMFQNSKLTSFDGDLNNLVHGNAMFENTDLTSFNGDLSSLVDGRYMFSGTDITSFNGDLNNLVHGNAMFRQTALTSFNGNLNSLANGQYMFYHSSLKSFNGNLNSLIDGSGMFEYTGLTSFDADLSSLVDGTEMFRQTALTSFNGDLSNLVDGTCMFAQSTLTSFNGDMSKMMNGYAMFAQSTLTSFNGDLSNLVKGSYMFSYTDLTSFNGDLSSLVEGIDMFDITNLDVDSVETICDVLPNWKENEIMEQSYNQFTDEITTAVWDGSYDLTRYVRCTNNYYSSVIGTSMQKPYVKTITIKWNDISTLTEAERKTVIDLMVATANEKGWTFVTNYEIDTDGTVSPTQVMAADGTIQRYIYVMKVEADEKTAKFVDADGKHWNVHTAECIIGPNVKYWELFATKEDAITAWGLSEYTYVEPTEEA